MGWPPLPRSVLRHGSHAPNAASFRSDVFAVMPEFRACPRACPVGQRNIRYPGWIGPLGTGSRADALGRDDNEAMFRSEFALALVVLELFDGLDSFARGGLQLAQL